MRREEEARLAGCRPARNDVRPLRHDGSELHFRSAVVEKAMEPLCKAPLTGVDGARITMWIDRGNAYQRLQQFGNRTRLSHAARTLGANRTEANLQERNRIRVFEKV